MTKPEVSICFKMPLLLCLWCVIPVCSSECSSYACICFLHVAYTFQKHARKDSKLCLGVSVLLMRISSTEIGQIGFHLFIFVYVVGFLFIVWFLSFLFHSFCLPCCFPLFVAHLGFPPPVCPYCPDYAEFVCCRVYVHHQWLGVVITWSVNSCVCVQTLLFPVYPLSIVWFVLRGMWS